MKTIFWKIWLRLNLLTKDVDNDYIAEVSTVGNTLHNEQIARQIVKERSEYRYDTILGIINERDAIVRDALLGGSSVQDGNVHLAPRITGNWVGSDPVFDPAAHKITVDATLTAEMRTALEAVGVEILGKKADGGAVIGLVTDSFTGKTDGTISVYGNLTITGEKIKIAPADEAGLGVFFVAEDGTETPDLNRLTQNDPKTVICRVPNLPAGTYILKIVTRFTSGNTLLKHPRAILYELPLKVEQAV
jgi:hypothetical protein